jgi:hypothetical protein
MIRWLDPDDFEASLFAVHPIGVKLGAFLHARSDVEPLQTVPHVEVYEDGLGPCHSSQGYIDDLPVRVLHSKNAYYYGLEVRFPVPITGDRMIIDALRQIEFSSLSSVYFETFPSRGSLGVFRCEEKHALYTSTRSENVQSVLSFLQRVWPGEFRVAPVLEPIEDRFIVTGPEAGAYFTLFEGFSSSFDAEERASKLSSQTGWPFLVRRSSELHRSHASSDDIE